MEVPRVDKMTRGGGGIDLWFGDLTQFPKSVVLVLISEF